jgi:PEP-CTERM motif
MRRIIIALFLLAGFALNASRTPQAVGSTMNLSTGLDASDALITVGNSPDAHWTVDQPAGGILPARVVTASDVEGIYIGSFWALNGPGSSWITIDATTVNNAPVIPYTYYRTFNLVAADVALASISGTWGIDDGGDLRLNGNLLSSVPNDYTATTPFSAAAGSGLFVVGLNTLSITMTFSDNSAEAVRLTGALTVPEPTTLTLMAFSAGVLLRRRRQQV